MNIVKLLLLLFLEELQHFARCLPLYSDSLFYQHTSFSSKIRHRQANMEINDLPTLKIGYNRNKEQRRFTTAFRKGAAGKMLNNSFIYHSFLVINHSYFIESPHKIFKTHVDISRQEPRARNRERRMGEDMNLG